MNTFAIAAWALLVAGIFVHIIVPVFRSRYAPLGRWAAWYFIVTVCIGGQGEFTAARFIYGAPTASAIYHLTTVGFKGKSKKKSKKREIRIKGE